MQHKFHKRARRPGDLARWELRLRLCHDHPSWAVRLWASVLSDAISVLRTRRTWLSAAERAEQRREVLEWLGGAGQAGRGGVGSFAWVCCELGLDEEPTRRGILALEPARPRRSARKDRDG